MKNQNIIKSTLLLGGGIGFNLLFWNERLGINLLVFSVFLLLIGFLFYPKAKTSKPTIITALGVLVTAGFMVFHNSSMAKFTNITSLLVFVGFLNQHGLKAIFYAIPTSIFNFVRVPLEFWKNFNLFSYSSASSKRHFRTLKIVIVPLLFFITFYVIFYYSNQIFAEYSYAFWTVIGDWLREVFSNISLVWIFLLLFGMLIVGSVLFQSEISYFFKLEQRLPNTLLRKDMKLKGNRTRPTFDILDLKNEYRSAFFLIVSINILLLLINVIDINWLWFNFKFDPSMNLSKYVHEGTYLLILSILLSIGLLLYFFRKNLNFYRKNEVLKIAASIWIFQNLILVISVAIRNYRYIHHFGLAYKRIGVIVFLIATVIGLITLFIKIDKRKSSYYLLNINSWCVYALLIIMSTINWDNVIVKHNIEYTNQRNLDVEFLLTLSDKTLPVIYENRSLIKDKVGFGNYRAMIAEEYLESRIRKFKWRMNHTNWRSWNYADAQAFKRLKILEK